MQLILIFLVLCWCPPNSRSIPTSNPDAAWRQSRYIIDNRRNGLFNKPFTTFYPNPIEDNGRRKFLDLGSSNETSTRRLFPVDRFRPKDLSAEASIIGTNFYQKYNENSLPRQRGKTIRIGDGELGTEVEHTSFNDFETEKNSSRIGYDPHNFIQAEDNQNVKFDLGSAKTVTENQKVILSGNPVLRWVPKLDDNILISVTSSTATTSKFKRPSTDFLPSGKVADNSGILEPRSFGAEEAGPKSRQTFGFGSPMTTSFPWSFSNRKPEEGNMIDKSPGFLNPNEKHVYETRIETVSYHQEIIFNQPKVEANTKKENWYREEHQQPEETTSYEEPKEDYEDESQNVTHQQSYEEPEKNYEEPEKNYEEPEKNYEESEKNYEEPEKNYEVDESVSVMTNGRVQTAESESEENKNKFGYVVEGRNYRKYRVEERTADGFIVGEYGVVSHDDGSLRGVRYTADGTTNPQLIYETLIKFLSL